MPTAVPWETYPGCRMTVFRGAYVIGGPPTKRVSHPPDAVHPAPKRAGCIRKHDTAAIRPTSRRMVGVDKDKLPLGRTNSSLTLRVSIYTNPKRKRGA